MNKEIVDPEEVKLGDVVQINPFSDLDPCYHGVYFIVAKVLSWGVMLTHYSPQIGLKSQPPSSFHLRVATDQPGQPKFFRVGQSPIIPGEIAKDIWPDAEVRTREIHDGEKE
ncbi:MAG: hypothetical protein JRI53_08090 [Deltaproteobacteria bacterium]|nr:hypothetical protein [Deltaproteobacteria bacterium]